MTSEEFVALIKLVVSDAAISDTIDVITSPPGRKPDQKLVDISKYYNRQKQADKDMIDLIIKKSVEEAIFGFFCVLDGVRAIENGEKKGELALLYKGENSAELTAGADLHDIYNSML
ncbi:MULTISPECIES: hypothetical protein [Pseudomonas]|uniref:Uncharacterized protein n=1 Tax=Pseudomonas quercus TaxID=2722792 RepID=A0ABX0YL32_9PSED|nr:MULTISPECIES: hypothetical protein [Pseudomonas]MBF7144345.1 hypothetical protein [Pseudomonas sp. LY10J]NJP02884.1 hypothetical protein [Pseudomonas quercus]